MGEENQETVCANDCRQQAYKQLVLDMREFPRIFISRSNSIGFIKVMLYCRDCAISGGRAKEQSEELVYIPGKIRLILGFVRALNLSLGIVAACLLRCQFIGILANTGEW